MRASLPSLLFFGLFVTGCVSQPVNFDADGRVSLKDGRPAVGMQGEICVVVTTGSDNSDTLCRDLITEANGSFSFNLREEIYRFILSAKKITRAEVIVQRGDLSRFSVRTLDLKQGLKATHGFDFVYPEGYSWGMGSGVLSVLERARATSAAVAQDAILSRFASEHLYELNPVEVIAIAKAVLFSTDRDSILSKYAYAQQDHLSPMDVVTIARSCSASGSQNSILLSYASLAATARRLDSRALILLSESALGSPTRDTILRLPAND